MTNTRLPVPTLVQLSGDDIARVARDVAQLVTGALRRREFRARFDELHARHEAGDESAGGEIWRLTQQALGHRLHSWALAHGRAESGEVIQDAVTDAVIRALSPGRYDPRLDARAWLLRIAQNRLREGWRHARSRPRLDAVGLDAALGQEAARSNRGAVSLDDPVERADAERVLDQRVRAKCRNVREVRLLRLRYLEGASIVQQAAAIGGGHLPHLGQSALINRWIKRIAARPARREAKSGRYIRPY